MRLENSPLTGVILFYLFWVVSIAPFSFAAQRPIIAVIKSRNITPYNTALEGFRQVLQEQGINAQLIEYELEGKRDEGLRIIEEIRAKNPDLILTVGSISTVVVLKNIRDIPVVFSMIIESVAGGFVKSLDSSGNNATGASMDIPINTQFENLKMLIPGIKRIGVVYNPAQSETIINEASIVARRMNLELVAKSVDSEKDVPEVLEELSKQIDCLWAVVDKTVYTPQSAKYILLFTLRNKIPFMAFSDNYVEAGALVALYCDYDDIGRQSAEIAIEILKGRKPNNIPISLPRKVNIAINLRVAKVIEIEIPASVLRRADKVFE